MRYVPRLFLGLVVALSGVALGRQPSRGPVINGGVPAVSPDGSRIAFVSNRDGSEDLYVISTHGAGEFRLTKTPEAEGALAWTADGKQVLFAVAAGDASKLYGIDPDGTSQRLIATVPGRAPTLSPDGRRLVFMAGTWTATRLMVSDSDGTNARQINDGSSVAWNNHWSPDGRLIAFTGRSEAPDSLAVFVMNADGSGRRQITRFASREGRAQWPVWSPDGGKLAIQVNDADPQAHNCHIWIVDVATGDARKLAAHSKPYLDETPSWFPDGSRLAFQSNRTGRMEVWMMNADGSEPRQVTGLPPR